MTASATVARRPLVLADLLPGTLARDVALVIGGALFVGLLAQISVPVPGSPVPVTGQTFAVILAGAALGTRRGVASMALYLLAGAAGMPWFASHSAGIHLPTLGYIIGFVAAAPLVGALAGRGGDRTPLRTVLSMAAGAATIYAFGVPFLALDLHLSASTAVRLGLTPFLLGDALKALLAAGLLPGTWMLVRRFSAGTD